jgi:twinkle protein
MESESEFLRKEPCPECGSKDNLGRYSDGHAFCFGCEYYEPSDEELAERSVTKTPKLEFTPLEGESRPIKSRKLHQETCQKFGYKFGSFDGQMVHIADIRDEKGRLKAQKVRFKNKDFIGLGDPGSYLMGMHLFQGGRKIIITEGELDALSFSQVQGNKYPVVSVPTGSKGAHKVIAKNLDYLSNFDEILLSFDMDDPGQEAAEKCAKLLMHMDVKLIDLPLKDASDMLKAGREEDLAKAVWSAKKYQPAGLMKMRDIVTAIRAPIEWGYDWFIKELTDLTYGRRLGEIYTLGAGTGVGKTDWFTQSMAFDVKVLREPVAAIYMEMAPEELGKRIAGKVAGRTFHIPDSGWNQMEMDEVLEDEEFLDMVNIWDSFGCTDFNEIEPAIIFLAAQGVKFFYIDHLTALATGGDKNEKEELEDVMARLGSLAKRHKIIIHLISHLATPDGGPPHEEGGRVTIRQFKGSRAIGFWSYFMFGLERNQQASDPIERQTTVFRILKDRYTGQSTGSTIPLNYDEEAGLIHVAEDSPFEDQEV